MSALQIIDPVIIDGYTQPGATPNTNGPGEGLNTVLKIELDGTNAGRGANGLYITGGNSTVKGLVINRFRVGDFIMSGIVLSSSGNLIEGNFLGTDVTGTTALGNRSGVRIYRTSNNTIGGTTRGARNLISGNKIGIWISESTGNLVTGSFIGTDFTGTADLGNEAGVFISTDASDNTIGGAASGAGNTIAFNEFSGVEVFSGTGNAILSNSIFSNDFLGIDLLRNRTLGVTPNDPADGDTGPNNLQNFPVLTSALGGSATIEGTLNSTPNTQFTLEFFSNSACDPSGFGEGETFLGFTDVTTDGSGNASFTITLSTSVPAGQLITATATDPDGNTSEFSQCTPVSP